MSGEHISGSHLEPESLAAFVDGALPRDEHHRVMEHLASCEDCYEVFADVDRFLAEERAEAAPSSSAADDLSEGEIAAGGGSVLRPPSSRWRAGSLAGFALAAAAAIMLLVWTPAGRFLRSSGRSPALAELTATLPAAAVMPNLRSSWQEHHWPTVRGLDSTIDSGQARAFQVGVRVAQLDVALAGGDAELALHLAQEVAERLEGLDPLPSVYGSPDGIAGQIRDGVPPAELLSANREADRLLAPDEAEDYPGFVDGFWYALGKWAGAAEMAAAARDPSLFAERANRRFLERAARRDLPLAVAARLDRIEELVTQQPDEHLPEIRRATAELIAVAGGGDADPTARAAD